MNSTMKRKATMAALALAGSVAYSVAYSASAVAQVTLYEHDQYAGNSVRVNGEMPNLDRIGFNDRASSMVIENGRWEVCEDARFAGRCVVLGRGQYDSLGAMGLNDRVSSLRVVNQQSGNMQDGPRNFADAGDYRRHGEERVYSVPVREVHAVFGPPEQRCWMEQEQVVENNGNSGYNVPGAIAGAVIGGVLGHQIGGGRGRDVATAGGAVAGGAIGANVGRDGGGQTVGTRDVQRCASAQQDRPTYWDVRYDYQGVEHRVQMTSPPGPTITVNRDGEPRY